jgi:hypothetical protein
MEDMDEINQAAIEKEILELGTLLGQRRAFGQVAGRCSAAQAECLRKIREQKTYLKFTPNWPEFCERYLHISSRTADRVIALIKKHGPLYFEAAAITGITPAEFEEIQGAIREDGIHIGGEVIALVPENSARAMEAVARLQAEAAAAEGAKPGLTAQKQIAELENRGKQLCARFHKTAKTLNSVERPVLIGSIKKLQRIFNQLELEIG